MSWWLVGVGAVLLVAAALGLWMAFRSPRFVAGLSAIAASAAWAALAPRVLKRDPKEAEWRKAQQAGRGDEYIRKKLGSLRD